ncbi:NACHT domain-containing protein [Streptomyces sp. NPDC055897]
MQDLVTELELNIKGCEVWHFDQICRYLDLYPNVRQTYSALITPGDVLFSLQELLQGTASELGGLLANHSSKELATDQWVKLGQAGEADNERLPLAELAIDPIASYTAPDGSHETVSSVRHILLHGDSVLRPSRLTETPPYVALIGGPGQGKSTVSQILCQAYRVALLKEARDRLDADTADTVQTFDDEMRRIGLTLPAARRWPIRINLSEYADAVAGGESISLLRYFADQISRRTPDITPNQLRSWLKAWPWLVVLDGLDEVASPQARDAVMERVNDFIIDARSVDADLLILATSRPQGYREEFSPRRYVHMRLEPLDTTYAVSYAKQLTQLRHSGDPDTAERVLERLAEAAEDDLTARLMTTPLQVTIMAILLERRQRVPQQRYRLFSDYYQTIYNREASKTGPVAKLIDDYRTTINHLHERVGLFLQVQAERAGDSDAVLSKNELSQITIRYLHDEGYDDALGDALAARIVDAAMRRLILLVPRKQECVGFDVRSLQEFMAARAIVAADADQTSDLLKAIATSAHWRNTWLLAAGCIFHERPYFRDRLVTLLDEIQAADELSLFLKPASSLAVDLLNDDVAAKAPRFLRSFTKHAVELLDEPMEEFEGYEFSDALWNVAELDNASRAAIEHAILKTLPSGGHGAVNALSFLKMHWDGQEGKLAYAVKKGLDKYGGADGGLVSYIGCTVLNHQFLISGLNDKTIKLAYSSFSEVMEPYVDVSEIPGGREILNRLFSGVDIGFFITPAGHKLAVSANYDGGGQRIKDMARPGVSETLIAAAEDLPVELWMVRYQLRKVCQSFQERRPAGIALLRSTPEYGELASLLPEDLPD